MKHIYYEEWVAKRVGKIRNIFGDKWFQNKKILELGACHGDNGIEFLKLGADVTFSDVRQELLDNITLKLKEFHYVPATILLNQEDEYTLDKKYDLVLHMGLLYNIKDWKNSIRCALNHTNYMILDTLVCPEPDQDGQVEIINQDFMYGPYNSNIMSTVSQEVIENELISLGCKFIRFDDPALNTAGWFFNDCFTTNIYDWTYESYNLGVHNLTNGFPCIRRFWLIIK